MASTAARIFLGMTPLALAVGCQPQPFHATDLGADDSGPTSGLQIAAAEPSSGPASGGTTVRLTGSGFSDASTATVGGASCASLTYLSDTELVCITPPGSPGTVDVSVVEGSASATTPFTYLPADTGYDTDETGDSADTSDSVDSGDTADSGDSGDSGGDDTATVPVFVDYCHIQFPCSMTTSAGATSEAVYGWVYLAAVTSGAGQGAGVRLQVGVGGDATDPETGAWTWTEMTYNADKDGLSPGDLANDEYGGTFTAPSTPGAYDYAVRATADDGASWLYCDGGGDSCPGLGSDDGYAAADAGQCTVI